jgi:hypothetical protein
MPEQSDNLAGPPSLPTPPTSRTRIHALLCWASWRAVALVVVTAAGWIASEAGAQVSERPGIHADGHLTILYNTLGLFVLVGLDIGVPNGGPGWAQTVLWFAYFAAPAITTSALAKPCCASCDHTLCVEICAAMSSSVDAAGSRCCTCASCASQNLMDRWSL